MFTITANKYKYNCFIGCMVFLFLLFSCNEKREERKIEPAFYYWKSAFQLTAFEKQRLDSLKVRTLYIKFFDVDWDEATRQAVPKARIDFIDSAYRSFNIIPTVFITNETFQKIETAAVPVLAENITKLINQLITNNNIKPVNEIQIDCDWTEGTKEKYFSFLTDFKKLNPGKIFSATIRLHQVKYITKSGIPPVDKGLLMCYNMGNLKNPATRNSIIETEEFKKYTGNLDNYTLPLDVALPLFDWKVLFRQNEYKGIIQHLPDSIFTGSLFKKAGNSYEVLKDSLLEGYDLKKGDILRNEESDYEVIIQVAAEVNRKLKNTSPRVSLYHLDSITLSKFSTHELESIYNSLR